MLGKPKILYRDDRFLSIEEIEFYQSLLKSPKWAPSSSYKNTGNQLEETAYWGRDLYRQYEWDYNWEATGWLHEEPPEWEILYKKISSHLPKHYIHWIDCKITSFGQDGVDLHRDRDPWDKGGDIKFSRAISVICNLNTKWKEEWGGHFQLWETYLNSNNQLSHKLDIEIPLFPGQLVIVENCYHSVKPIIQPKKSRISFILHVLEYNN